MKNKRLLYLFTFFVILLVFAYASTATVVPEKMPVHKVRFYDEKKFLEGVSKAKTVSSKEEYVIRGGIVPHHLFAGFIIADFFKRISLQNPQTIILLGPNHYEKGNFKVLTSLYSWGTAYGVVDADHDVIKILQDKNLVKVDEMVLPNDHALSGMMPFIRFYMPHAKVVPLLISGTLTQKDSELLAENITRLLNKNTVVIAPVDFSHYLTTSQANEKDKITLQTMKDFDYRKLYLMNNDYLDSPPSIGTFLMIMQKQHTTKMDLLFHANSGEMQNELGRETTSYFSTLYY